MRDITYLDSPSLIDRGGELDLEVRGEGRGDMEAGVMGERGELQGASDRRHLTWSWERLSSLLSDSRSLSFSWMMASRTVSCLLMVVVISISLSPLATILCCSARRPAASPDMTSRASSSEILRLLLTSEVRLLA